MSAVVSASWKVGQRVGRFELLRELARGGMAEIWVAQEKDAAGASQPVVVKRMLGDDEDLVPLNMLLDEARILSQLSHPGIVRVFGLEELDGSPAIVMELVSGLTLEQLLELTHKRGLMPPALAVHIAAKVASALGYAHRKTGANDAPLQVIHRDVSPANIMISEQGGVKLLDFGIARARNRSTKTISGYIKGKVAYMSPEQSSGKGLDARSDVFSLALVLAEMLSGQSVYADKSEVQIASMLAGEEKFAPIHDRNPGVARSLEMLVEEAMSIDPAGRPADGQFFAQRLEGWLALLPTRPHESDLSQYLSMVRAPAPASAVVPTVIAPLPPGTRLPTGPLPVAATSTPGEKPASTLPLKVTQRTPSFRATPSRIPKKKINPTVLAIGALLLFAGSVVAGWVTSRRVFAPPPEQSRGAPNTAASDP